MTGASIEVRDLCFGYEDRLVLSAVSFSIPRGEIWALIGRSGAGKTTLLQIIAGLFQPTQGSVSVSNRLAVRAGRIRGIVFQEDALLGWLTVRENMLFPSHRKPSPDKEQVALDILNSVGLSQRLNSYPSQLSAGMRKRLEFARALVADDEYILADEPFGTVDALTRRDLWALWAGLRQKQPRTGILCTHDPEEAVRLCDAVIVLQGSEPARASNPVRVPSELKLVPIECEDPKVSKLKQLLLKSLNGAADASQ